MTDGPVLHVAAVVVDDGRLLLVRRGPGPAGGTWDLPGAALAAGQTILEAVVEAVSADAGLEAVGGAFLGFDERLEDEPHTVRVVVQMLLPGDADPSAGDGVAEARWFAPHEVGDLRFAPGVPELLHDHEVLELIT
jgi:ADP-ribose pyrophosphatase YjhB (NUDIX family)